VSDLRERLADDPRSWLTADGVRQIPVYMAVEHVARWLREEARRLEEPGPWGDGTPDYETGHMINLLERLADDLTPKDPTDV
jgi:hypothetical protein